MRYRKSKFPLDLLLILALLIVIIQSGYSQVDYTGYIYFLPTYQKIPETSVMNMNTNEDDFLTFLTRARLMPSYDFNQNSRITMQYEMNFMYSKAPLLLYSGTSKTNRQAVDLNWIISDDEDFKAQHFIDMLYYKHLFTNFEFTIGRQVISWGSGRIWQPTDLFNPINPANFSKFERDGADAISAKYYLGSFSDIELVWNFRERLDMSNYGGRLRTNFETYDISVISGYFDKRFAIGGAFEGNLFDAGIRGEVLHSSYKSNDSIPDHLKIIFGIDYQFTSEFYLLAEYHFNGSGTIVESDYSNYLDKLIKGEIQNIGKNYIAIQGSYLITPIITSSLLNINNLNDGSGFINLSGTYSIDENINLNLGSMIYYGKTGSEYSFYPPAVYLVLEWFF